MHIHHGYGKSMSPPPLKFIHMQEHHFSRISFHVLRCAGFDRVEVVAYRFPSGIRGGCDFRDGADMFPERLPDFSDDRVVIFLYLLAHSPFLTCCQCCRVATVDPISLYITFLFIIYFFYVFIETTATTATRQQASIYKGLRVAVEHSFGNKFPFYGNTAH